MNSDHDHIFNQMKRDAIDDALAYYNLGERGTRETVFVHGLIRWYFGSTVKVTLTRGRRASEEFEWLRSAISFEWESAETALIRIPLAFVTIFDLSLFVLDDHDIERHKRYVEHFNSPKLPPPPRRALQTVGGVRI